MGVIDQRLLLAPLRHCDLDFVSGMSGERLLEKLFFLDVVRQQDQWRNRLVVIKLRQERAQDFRYRQCLVGAREIRSIAPILPGAEKEYLDAGLAAFLRQAEDIGLVHPLRIDALLGSDETHRLDTVAIARGALEIELFRSLLHQPGEISLHRLALAVEKGLGLLDQLIIDRQLYLPGA